MSERWDNPRVWTSVEQVTLKPGQVLTVWLDREASPSKRSASQVELRVTKDGKRQVIRDDCTSVLTFEEAYPE